MTTQPVDVPTYIGDALKCSSLSLSTMKVAAWRWEAFVYSKRPGKKMRIVYSRRCLNETHARKVAAETAKRFQSYAERTGKAWEDRAALVRRGVTA